MYGFGTNAICTPCGTGLPTVSSLLVISKRDLIGLPDTGNVTVIVAIDPLVGMVLFDRKVQTP